MAATTARVDTACSIPEGFKEEARQGKLRVRGFNVRAIGEDRRDVEIRLEDGRTLHFTAPTSCVTNGFLYSLLVVPPQPLLESCVRVKTVFEWAAPSSDDETTAEPILYARHGGRSLTSTCAREESATPGDALRNAPVALRIVAFVVIWVLALFGMREMLFGGR